jgi:hypothetical protein
LRENADLLENVLGLSNSVLDESLSAEQILESIDLGVYGGGKTGRFWTLDPIDGTKGFLRGEQYAVCLALIENGQVQVAIQGCPNLLRNIHDPSSTRGSLFIAVRGQGAFEVIIVNHRDLLMRKQKLLFMFLMWKIHQTRSFVNPSKLLTLHKEMHKKLQIYWESKIRQLEWIRNVNMLCWLVVMRVFTFDYPHVKITKKRFGIMLEALF